MTDSQANDPEQAIPLEARKSFIDHTQTTTAWTNALAIAENIGIYDRWVYRTVKELGIKSEMRMADGVEVPMYPPWTVNVLREELRWREHVRELPEELSVGEMAESLGRSYGWTQKTLEGADAKPIRKRGPVRYGKQSLRELRHISMAVPLDDGWYNLRQLVELTGQDREWIERRIIEAGYEAVDRRSALTGRVLDHYPPEVLSVVTAAMAERAVAGGEWMTVLGMAKRLGRNEKWVNGRVGEYQELYEMRQDDNGVTRVHYPPSVLEALEAESERNRTLPERGDYLNVHEVARLAGHGTEWAEKRLAILGIEPELRRDGKGRAQLCYNPCVVQVLKEYEEQNPEQDGDSIAESIWNARVTIGSLRSQIKLKQAVRKEIRQTATDDERQAISSEIAKLQRDLWRVTQRLGQLEIKARDEAEFGG